MLLGYVFLLLIPLLVWPNADAELNVPQILLNEKNIGGAGVRARLSRKGIQYVSETLAGALITEVVTAPLSLDPQGLTTNSGRILLSDMTLNMKSSRHQLLTDIRAPDTIIVKFVRLELTANAKLSNEAKENKGTAKIGSNAINLNLEITPTRTTQGAPNMKLRQCKILNTKFEVTIASEMTDESLKSAIEADAHDLFEGLLCSRIEYVIEDRVNDRFGLLSPKITLAHINDDELIRDLADRLRARRQRRQYPGGLGAGIGLPMGMRLGAGLGRKKRSPGWGMESFMPRVNTNGWEHGMRLKTNGWERGKRSPGWGMENVMPRVNTNGWEHGIRVNTNGWGRKKRSPGWGMDSFMPRVNTNGWEHGMRLNTNGWERGKRSPGWGMENVMPRVNTNGWEHGIRVNTNGWGRKKRSPGWGMDSFMPRVNTNGWENGIRVNTNGWGRKKRSPGWGMESFMPKVNTNGWENGIRLNTNGWERGKRSPGWGMENVMPRVNTNGWEHGIRVNTNGWGRKKRSPGWGMESFMPRVNTNGWEHGMRLNTNGWERGKRSPGWGMENVMPRVNTNGWEHGIRVNTNGWGRKKRSPGWGMDSFMPRVNTNGWENGIRVNTNGWGRKKRSSGWGMDSFMPRVNTNGWENGIRLNTNGWERGKRSPGWGMENIMPRVNTNGWEHGMRLNTNGWERGKRSPGWGMDSFMPRVNTNGWEHGMRLNTNGWERGKRSPGWGMDGFMPHVNTNGWEHGMRLNTNGWERGKRDAGVIPGFNVSHMDTLFLDYTIMGDMKVTNLGLEIESSGEVSLRGRGGTPFGPVPAPLPESVHEDSMLQMIVSDYMVNSLMYHGHTIGLFKTRVDPTTPHFGPIMKTSCSLSSGMLFCLGDLFPTLRKTYPERRLVLFFNTLQAPVIVFHPASSGGIKFSLIGRIAILVVHPQTKAEELVAEMKIDVDAQMKMRLSSSMVRPKISLDRIKLTTMSPGILLQNELDDAVLLAREVLQRMVNDLLKDGIPIPVHPLFKLVKPKVKVVERALLLQTNFELNERLMRQLTAGDLERRRRL
ncbi:unnamed protein product [Bursaphelenchus okinawaensis]|uniref:Lipid-binding serum glycoprotein C-terminal domain-containing protein n=1 Tax=Bursaphelenchus okinawaensis TaxID=465554 RepID=A0A811KI43_9BILA|nr:unnamed protein product [Bursaphelenchus okinawaensis]CAG9105082.1 unnamed protein product [Bursaphelenchus okinawaensis]